MKSANYTYATPCIEIMEVDLENGVLNSSEQGAGSEGLNNEQPINLFGE